MIDLSHEFNQPMPPVGFSRRMRWVKWATGVVILALLSTSGYFYWQYREAKKNPEKAALAETTSLVTKVGKLMELPTGETPTVATVSNKDSLKDQEFFKNSENGDKMLIYAGYRMVVLYRPGTNRIVKVAPLVMGQETTNTNKAVTNSNTNSAVKNTAP